jgi:hypothetical protein
MHTMHGHHAGPRHPATCVGCGYEITGLTIGSPCPECGLTINPLNTAGLAAANLPTSGWAVASLVMGILSLTGCVFWGLPALILGPLAIWFAGKARRDVAMGAASAASLGLATAGRVCGIVGTALAAAGVLIVGTMFLSAVLP